MSSALGPDFERGLRIMLDAIARAQQAGFPDASTIDMAAELAKLTGLRGTLLLSSMRTRHGPTEERQGALNESGVMPLPLFTEQ